MADNFVPMNLDSLLGPLDEKKAKEQQEQPADSFIPMDLGHIFSSQDSQTKPEAPTPTPKPTAPVLPPPTNEADPRFTREYQMLPKDAQGNAVVPLPIPLFEGMFPAVTLPTGQKSETIPIAEAAGKLLDYSETLPDPPKSVMDWMTRVVPESTAKNAIGLVKFMFHDLPRPFTDAVIQYAKDVMAEEGTVQAGQKPIPDDVVLDTLGVPTTRDPASDKFFEALGKGVAHLVNGLARFSGEPIGVYGWDKMKQAWMQNPAGALLGIAPFITKGMEARSSKIHQQSIEAGAREAELDRLFDQPRGLDKYKELSERLDQRQEKVYKTKSGAISAASYFEDALGERVEVIENEGGGFKIKRSGKLKEAEQAEAAQAKQAAEEKLAERKQKKYQTLAGAKSAARYFEDKLGEQVIVTKHEDGSFRIERTGKPIKREAPIDEYIASTITEDQAGEYAEEASDAARVRKDEGQVYEGGAVEEGSTEEGSKNLEQQPQEQPSGSKETSTKEEVSQTLDGSIIFPEGTDLDGMLAELQSQPPSIEQAVDVEIVKLNQALRDKGPNIANYIEDVIANLAGMYADLDSLMVAFPDADWDNIELKIQGAMDLWDRIDPRFSLHQAFAEQSLRRAQGEARTLRSEAEHRARMEHIRLKEAALDAAERGAAVAKGAVKPSKAEIEQARVMLAEGLSTYIKKLYRFGEPLDKYVEADLWSQIERKVGKSAAASLKARFEVLENSGRMIRLVNHAGELIDAFAYELAQGIKAGKEAEAGKAKPAKPEQVKNLLTKDQELLIKALYRLKDDPEKFAEGLMWAREEGVVDRTFAEAIRDNFDLLKKSGTTDRVMSSMDRMRNSFSVAVDRTLKKKGEILRLGVPLPKLPKEVKEFIKKMKIAPQDLHRNKEIFDKFKIWLGKDGAWRKWVDYKPELFTKNKPPVGKLKDVYPDPELMKELPKLYNKVLVTKDKHMLTAASMDELGNLLIREDTVPPNVFHHELQHGAQFAANLVPHLKPLQKTQEAKILRKAILDARAILGPNEPVSNTLVKAHHILRNPMRTLATPVEIERWFAQLESVYPQLDPVFENLPEEMFYTMYITDPVELEAKAAELQILPSKPGEYPWDRVESVLRRQGLDSRFGHDLYVGIPTKEIAKLFRKDKKLEKVAKVASRQKPEDPSKIPLGDGVATLQDVENYFDKVRKKSNPPIRETLKAGKEEAIKAITDTRGLAKRDLLRKYGDAGYRAIQRMSLLRGSPAKTFRELEMLRKKVYKGLSKKMSGFLDEIIYGMRVVQIDNYRTGIKHPGNLGGDVFEPYLKRFAEMKGISEGEAANLMAKANKYFKFLRGKLDEMLDEGLISKEEHSELIKFNYSRRQAIDKIDPKRIVPGKGKVTVRDSGIESLAHGRATELLELDSKLLAAEVLGRANARIFKNRMNRELSKLAELEVDGPLIKKPMLTKKGKVKPAPPGWTTMSYMDNGEMQSFYVPESFAMDLGRTHSLGYMESNLIRTLSGSGLLRAMATGINWSFPLVNFMRDISTVYLASGYYRDGKWKSTYSNILPVGIGQIGRDLEATFVDTLYKGKKYQEAMDQGLGMELLTTQGRFSKRRLGTDTALDHLQETLGAFGTFGETWVRMALKHRGERLGMDPVESTFLARDYLDFSDFGYLTKTIDTQVPYLMATINATRSLWRSARRDPSSFIAKSLQIGAVSYALRSMMNRYFPNDSDKVSEYDKYHSWNIMLPATFTENGERRRLYFKLPKDPSQQFIAAAFEAMADIQAGKEVNLPGLVDMLRSLSPVGEVPIAPSAKMLVEYFSNIDLWRAAQIANPSVEASEQWDVDTHPAMRELGRIGISPKRASTALRNILPPSNSFIGLASLGYKQLVDQVPEDVREDANYHMLTQIPITDRFFGATREVFADRKQMKEATVEEGTKAHIARRSIDMAFKNQSADAAQALIANESDPSLRKIMIEQYHLDEKMGSLQFDTTWWRAFLTVPAAGRGKIYNDKVMELQGEALDKFLNDARLLGSIFKGETLRSIQIDQAQRPVGRE